MPQAAAQRARHHHRHPAAPRPVSEALQRLTQSLVGRHQVGLRGVAAELGHGLSVQDRGRARIDGRRDVGVPASEGVLAPSELLLIVAAVPLLVRRGRQ